MSDERRGGTSAPEHSTLYVDPGARVASAHGHGRGRVVRRAVATSDVTRFRGLLAATGAGAIGVLGAVLIFPPQGGLASPGPLSRPHALAGLTCASCHEGDATAALPGSPQPASTKDPHGSRAVADAACARCHGPHPSMRRGHERVIAAGEMRCATCHTIHRGDEGVTFTASGPAIRFAPGTTVNEDRVPFHPPASTTVALVSAANCAACHDLARAADPIARCLASGGAKAGEARPVTCFDEHQAPLAPLLSKRVSLGANGVCAGQHTLDRPLAWEAAREVAALWPTIAPLGGSGGGFTWLGTGLGAAALAFGVVRGRDAIARRKSLVKDAPNDALLRAPARIRLPQIDTNTCLGCYACVDACPYDVLEIERYVARVARPDACCGLTLCEQRCPNGSLVITDGEPIGDRPRITASLESEDAGGVYLAGDVTGLPLIKNAILQGAHAATRVAESLARSAGDESALDLIIVGAGPAGISAALRAKELGMRFEVLEQGSVAQSIQSFPRGKLVFDQPLELPITGKLWLKESTKEELLGHWLRLVRKEKLPIFEDTRMKGFVRGPDGVFVITTEPREGGAPTTRRARRILLAIGQRGTPRRLPFEVEPEALSRIHYHLADARSFEGKQVIVVGLGDVAMEAALALAGQPGTAVTILYRGPDFSRGKTRNIDAVRRLVAAGRITLRFEADPSAIDADRVHIVGREAVSMPYDAVFVLIGSIPPRDVLRDAGVRTVGEGAA